MLLVLVSIYVLFSPSKVLDNVFVRYWYVSDHLLGKSCSFGLPNVLFVLCLFVVLVVSDFDFHGGTLYLIASVPGHCLPLTFWCK